ncbi:hypothetical protein C8J56DRAFT_890787 [Mycena floridula]|nr:hypothetical protein C8J56DRAFT_890787 [Mycena floridula]
MANIPGHGHIEAVGHFCWKDWRDFRPGVLFFANKVTRPLVARLLGPSDFKDPIIKVPKGDSWSQPLFHHPNCWPHRKRDRIQAISVLLHDLEMMRCLRRKAVEIMWLAGGSLLSTSVKWEHRQTSIFYRFGLEEKGVTEDLGTLAVVAISVHLNSSSPEKGPKAGSNRKGKAPKSGNQLHSFTTLKLHETLCRYRRIIERRNNVACFKSTFVSLGESITMKERRATRMDEHKRASPLTRSRQASGKLELRHFKQFWVLNARSVSI